jgi:AraC family transcriptional regulator, dual regulator of chb operon
MSERQIFRWDKYVIDPEVVCVPTLINGSARYSYPLHIHAGQMEVLAVIEGTLAHSLNGRTVMMDAGAATFIAEKDEHALSAKGGPVRFINIAFSVRYLASLVDHFAALRRYGVGFSVELATRDRERFLEYGLELLARRGSDASALLIEFLLWFARVALGVDRGSASESRRRLLGEPDAPVWFEELVYWAERPGMTVPTVEALVTRAKRSHEHVSRSFRRYRGVSPTEYVNALRVRRAKDLLAHSNWSLSDVCFSSGFESLGRFYTIFREAEGLPPGRYRAKRKRSPYAEGANP